MQKDILTKKVREELEELGLRQCSKCKEIKDRKEFYWSCGHNLCKDCANKKSIRRKLK